MLQHLGSRVRFDKRIGRLGRKGIGAMAGLEKAVVRNEQESPVERQSICFPRFGTTGILQSGDSGFANVAGRHYSNAESVALEQLIDLKTRLRAATADDFFSILTEGMSKILGAEICFVMKRVLMDDQDSAVEMPPIGEPGSCLMAAALHYCANDGTGARNTVKSTKYAAWGCPCAYMRHDKIFLISDRLNEFITNNPNTLPYPCESYIAVPLKSEGKCFAHFGAMWSTDAAKLRTLSWAIIELILHSLEDMVLNRLLEGSNFLQKPQAEAERQRVIPHEVVTMAQSLRPYAGSLSHELRTPMQGVVGMLDVMYATVQEAVETQADPRLRKIFSTLKENIEAVQDSSRRAVEAADNVVHAYDMDMSVPDGPVELLDDNADANGPQSATVEKRPEILVEGSNLPLARSNKRRRDDSFPRASEDQPSSKVPRTTSTSSACRCGDTKDESDGAKVTVDNTCPLLSITSTVRNEPQTPPDTDLTSNRLPTSNRIIMPGLRHTNLKELIQHIISEGLKVGGRPDSAVALELEHGENIEVRIRRSNGTIGTKFIEWTVDPNVPDTLWIDEMDLSKLISRVFLNAIKFTDTTSGQVKIRARMSNRGRYISIKISDNGPGIPAAFLPRLFKPFSQEDPSLTRSSEGLGLGLMVAKGIARKLGGDLTCNRTETDGPDHGSEFEIKVPLHAGESLSRPSSPFGSPLPRKVVMATVDTPQLKSTPASSSSHKWTKILQEAVGIDSIPSVNTLAPMLNVPSSPPSPRSIVDLDLSRPPTGAKLIKPEATPLENSEAEKPVISGSQTPLYKSVTTNPDFDRKLAEKYPLNFLVAEDNKINRKLLVSMLRKFGYKTIHEAHDGAEAVRQMARSRAERERIDVILMDLWMPLMDGYEATERILKMDKEYNQEAAANGKNGQGDATHTSALVQPTVLAVTADVTDAALERAAMVGMKGFMSKPYKLMDLQRLITEYCAKDKIIGNDLPSVVPAV